MQRQNVKYQEFIEFAHYVQMNMQDNISRTEIKHILAVILLHLQEMAQEMKTSHDVENRNFQSLIQLFSETMQSISNIQECKEKIVQFVNQELMGYCVCRHLSCRDNEKSQADQAMMATSKALYICHCPEKKHLITLDVHEKIATQQTQFRCKLCKQFVVFESFC